MSEKINLSLFENFFELPLPADYAEIFINTEDPDKNKKIRAEIEDRISVLKNRIKKWAEQKKKKKNAGETLEIIKEILDYNKDAQKNFQLASKVDKGKSESKLEKNIAERVKLKNEKIAETEKEEKNINNNLFKNYSLGKPKWHVQKITQDRR